MKKRRFLLALVAVLTVTMVGACNKESRTTVTFWHTMGKTTDPSEGGQALLEKFIGEFEKANPDIRVKHEAKGGYDDLASAVSKALVAGNQPSMAYSYTDHVAAYLRTGRVQELDSLINHPEYGLTAEELADYVPGYLAEGRVFDEAGTTYSMPYTKSTEVMFVNGKILRENGITVYDEDPHHIATWDEIEEMSETLKTKLGNKMPSKGVIGYDSSSNHYITTSEQGQIPYTELPKGESNGILFNNTDAKDMLKYFKGLYDKKYFNIREMLGSNTSNYYVTNDLLLSIGSTGGTKYNVPAANSTKLKVDDVIVAPIPFYGAEEDIGSKYKVIQQGPNINLFVKKDEKEVIAAWKFLKYITEPRQQAQWSMATGYSPVRLSTYQDTEFADYLDETKLDLNTYEGKRQKIFIDVLKMTGWLGEQDYFFVSPAFSKSSKARLEVGVIFKDVFGKTNPTDNDIDKIFKDAYDRTAY